MTFTPHGKHLIAGAWVAGDESFQYAPAHGPSHSFSKGTPAHVNAACDAAEEAFWDYGYSTREARATFLNTIADEIEARAEAITEIGTQETGLPEARLNGERGRTTGQLRLFADHILKGDYTPLSAVDIFVKDLNIVHSTGRELKLAMPVAGSALQQFTAASGAGFGREDDSAVIKVYQRLGSFSLPAANDEGAQ